MSLFGDEYNINKINEMPIVWAIDRQNEIKNKQLEFEKETKDRVDISLNDYNEMKKTITFQNNLIKSYENFINKLSQHIRICPDDLLKYECIKSEVTGNIATMTNELHIVFRKEIGDDK